MLDPLGIHRRDPGVDPDGEEKPVDDLVSSATRSREAAAGIGEANGFAGPGLGETVTLESLDGPDHRDVGDPETQGEFGHPTAVLAFFEFRDRLAIVLGDLRGMIVAGALVRG